jgi:hypothetical protein
LCGSVWPKLKRLIETKNAIFSWQNNQLWGNSWSRLGELSRKLKFKTFLQCDTDDNLPTQLGTDGEGPEMRPNLSPYYESGRGRSIYRRRRRRVHTKKGKLYVHTQTDSMKK